MNKDIIFFNSFSVFKPVLINIFSKFVKSLHFLKPLMYISESQSLCSESMEDDYLLDFEVIELSEYDKKVDTKTITLLLAQTILKGSEIENNQLFEKFKCAVVDDYVFYMVGFLETSKFYNLMDNKMRTILEKHNQNNIKHVFISGKYSNTPFNMINNSIKSIKNIPKSFLVFMKCKILSDKEAKNALTNFPEFKLEDLKHYPYNEEEIFMINECVSSKIINIGPVFYRILILTDKNFINFMKLFDKEVSQH